MRVAPRLVLTTAGLWFWPLLALAQPASNCGYYAYGGVSEGRHCAGTSDAPPPQRVTAVCRDQSYSYEVGSWTCWDHGGVKTRLR